MPKLILSRKGFDSSAGGGPSPILGQHPLSLPIPQAGTQVPYETLQGPEGNSYAAWMQKLGITIPETAHHDPDLVRHSRARKPGWKAGFGQTGAALRHLQNEGVGEGDLFLFFGWFRQAEQDQAGKWQFQRKAPDLHVLFGYLEVGRIIDLNQEVPPSWAQDHPHWVRRDQFGPKGNALFIGAEQSSIWPGKAGAGEFSPHPAHTLTDISGPKIRRSLWRLPSVFFDNGQCQLSYHRHKTGLPMADGFQLDIARRGQEFVCDRSPEHEAWVQQLEPR